MSQNLGGADLGRAIESLGITQFMAEERLGVSRGYVSRLVSGDRVPSRRVALLIRKHFGVSVDAWDAPEEAACAEN